jgi:hypothetical protein
VEEDRLVWKEEQHGEYTVRSSYRVVMRAKEEETQRGVDDNWKCLWQILGPPKTKHILWRICPNVLPTLVQLRNHYVQFDGEEKVRRGRMRSTYFYFVNYLFLFLLFYKKKKAIL